MHPNETLICAQCEQEADRLTEGVCDECHAANAEEAARFRFEQQRWDRLTDTQREKEIRWAARHFG